MASPFEAEDAVQETMLRAWRSQAGFERASLRSWLYQMRRTSVSTCSAARRRVRPMDLGPPAAGVREPERARR
jgi:RNA polymerase sigma-70 factor (ECF subfamily)